jgi:hypothetical protein
LSQTIFVFIPEKSENALSLKEYLHTKRNEKPFLWKNTCTLKEMKNPFFGRIPAH